MTCLSKPGISAGALSVVLEVCANNVALTTMMKADNTPRRVNSGIFVLCRNLARQESQKFASVIVREETEGGRQQTGAVLLPLAQRRGWTGEEARLHPAASPSHTSHSPPRRNRKPPRKLSSSAG